VGETKTAIIDQYLASSRVVTLRPPSIIHTAAPDRGKLVTLIASKRRRLLFTGDGRRSVYDKKPQRYAEDNRTEFNCMRWSGKSEVEITNNKRLRSRHCTVEATGRHESSRGLSTTAELRYGLLV